MSDFESELEYFRREEESAQQHFFVYLALHKVPSEDAKTLDAMNQTPLFWRTSRYGSLVAAFITLGRIFDEDSEHNVNTLLRLAGESLHEFNWLRLQNASFLARASLGRRPKLT